jgi:glycosyltransferase EpsD
MGGKRILYIATSDIHINIFHIPFLKWLWENHAIVHLVVENRGGIKLPYIEKQYSLEFPRNVSIRTYSKSYRDLKKIINENQYDIIHCHTPLPSLITRLASRQARRKGAKVLYTVHGFHFYKGGPIKKWLIFYPVEYFLSAFTDGIITMNKEDFNYVNNKMFHKKSFLIPGVGVNPEVFKPLSEISKNEIRNKLGYSNKDLIIIYVAEFSKRKNHQLVLKALAQLNSQKLKFKVLFVGTGLLEEEINQLSGEYRLKDEIDFLGFRNDVADLTAISDIGISSSRQEGLPVGILQEMFCGLPIIASEERGHKELVKHGENGFLFPQNRYKKFAGYLQLLIQDQKLRATMGKKSFDLATPFSIGNSIEAMAKVYSFYLK